MTREDVSTKVTEVLIDKLGADPEEASNEGNDLQNDLGADSLDAIELIIEFEEVFHITIPEDDAEEIHTIKDIIDYIYEQVG